MAKRLTLYTLSLILVLTTLFGFMPAQQVKAVDADNWNHVIPFTITDTSGVARTNVPVIITYDTSGKLVAYGLVNATATDTYVDSSGASNSPIGSGTAYDFMMASDNITAVIPSLPAYGSVTINLYTGYSPEQTSFPIITGNGGYFTVADAAALEPSDNFTIAFEDTYINTDNNTDKYLFDHWDSNIGGIRGFVSPTDSGNVTARIAIPQAGGDTPTIEAVGGGNDTVNDTNHTVNMPASIESGELIIALFTTDGNDAITFPAGWTQLYQQANGASVNHGAWYRVADGTETATITVTTAGAQMTAHTTYRISGYYGTPEAGTAATGTSTQPDPPSLTVSWGSENNLWLAVCGYDLGASVAAVSAYPASYTDGRDDRAANVEGAGSGTARRANATATENPAVYTLSTSVAWVANTIGIAPRQIVNTDVSATGVTSAEHDIEVNYQADVYISSAGSGYVNLGSDSTMNSVNGTVELWANAQTITDGGYWYSNNSNEWSIYFTGGASPGIQTYYNGSLNITSYFSTAPAMSADKWYHIVWTFTQGGTGYLYVNGVLRASAACNAGAPTGGNVYVGAGAGGGGATTGYFDEFRLYSRVLALGEVNHNYQQGRDSEPQPLSETDLEALLHLDEGTGTAADDETSNGNDGTLTNTTWSGIGLQISIDGVLQDTNLVVTDVLDSTANWTFMQNNVTDFMPYSGNISIEVDGVLQAWYEPNAMISGTTLPDRQGADNNGTITWGSNSDITITGGDIMDSESATSVGVTSAMMQGELFYIGTYASVYLSFQYGLDTNYGYSTSETSAATEQTYSVTLTGLTPNTTYHYRAVARNGSVYSYGADTTFTTAYSTASEGSTTPLIQSIGVFSGYQQTGDLLFTAEIVLTYPPYYPTDVAYKYFQMQLVDTDGSTILGASPISQWGDRPASIYLNSTVSANLTYGSAYQIRVANISSENITVNTNDTLGSGDWYGDDLTRLDDWCIGVAWSMQSNDGTLLTDPYLKAETGYGVIITNTAGGYFVKGIPNITRIRPSLFATGEHTGTESTPSGTINYNTGTTLTDRLGAGVVADAETVGDVFDISGQNFLLYMILAVVLFCIVFTVSNTQGFGALGATILTIPIIGASAYFNIMNIALPVIGIVILSWLFVRQFIWKTT